MTTTMKLGQRHLSSSSDVASGLLHPTRKQTGGEGHLITLRGLRTRGLGCAWVMCIYFLNPHPSAPIDH